MSELTSPGGKTGRGTRPGKFISERPWTYYVTLCYVCLTPWIVIPTGFGFSVGASDVLLPFALIALVAEAPRRRSAGTALLMSFFGLAYLATAVVAAQEGGFDLARILALSRAVAVLTPFLVAVAHGPFSQRELQRLLNWLLVSGTSALALGWVYFRLGIRVRDEQQTIWTGSGASALRAGGLTGNSTSFGSLAVTLAVFAVVLAVLTATRLKFTALFVLLSFSAVIIASSRASLLNMAIAALLFFPVFFRGRALWGVVTALFGSAGVVSLGLVASQIQSGSTVSSAFLRLDFLNLSGHSTFFTSNTRLDSWQAMSSLFQEHWLWGTGYDTTVGIVGNAGDNSFLSVLVELGILSGVAFVLFWLCLGLRFVSSGNPLVRWAAVALWAGEVAQMFTVDSYREWTSTPITMAALGILYVASGVGLNDDAFRSSGLGSEQLIATGIDPRSRSGYAPRKVLR